VVIGVEGGNVMQRTGLSDTFVAHRYWHGWLEFKSETGKLRKTQEVFLRQMMDRGVPAFVVRAASNLDIRKNGTTPGIIENWDGTELARFSGAKELLHRLALLTDVERGIH
jgi:hypothetical protein